MKERVLKSSASLRALNKPLASMLYNAESRNSIPPIDSQMIKSCS